MHRKLPVFMRTQKTAKRFVVYLPEEVYNQVEEEANAEGLSLSSYVRNILINNIRVHKENMKVEKSQIA